MGRGIIESGLFRTEQLEIEQRTADPATPEPDEEWLRVDIKPQYEDANGTTQTGLAEYRVANGDGTVDTAPVAAVGDAVGENVIDKDRLYVDAGGSPTGTGFIPQATSGAAYPNRRLEHPTDGQVAMHNALTASAIPDSVVFLDDWADGNLTSDRDDYNTTLFGGTDSTLVPENGSGSLQRPAWTVDRGTPSVSSETLTVETSGGTGDKLRADLSLSSLDNYTWEFKVSSAAGACYVSLTANSTTFRSSSRANYEDGYYVLMANDIGLYVDDSGSSSSLISASLPSTPFVIRVERDASGGWELFVDGASEGAETDTTHSTSTYGGISANDGVSESRVDLNWFGVDDGS